MERVRRIKRSDEPSTKAPSVRPAIRPTPDEAAQPAPRKKFVVKTGAAEEFGVRPVTCEFCKRQYLRPCHGKDKACQNKLYLERERRGSLRVKRVTRNVR